MLKKKRLKSQPICKVTFEAPRLEGTRRVFLVGDFNGWDSSATPMKKSKEGRFSVTLDLEPGREYQFRYLFEGRGWENDWEADRYTPNTFGGENSVVST